MKLALVRKTIRESELLLLSSAFIMFAFCWLRVWMVSLLPTDRFQTILEQFRDFERFAPVPFEQLFTYPGRIALTYDELIVVMCVVIWSIARGSDCVAGELGRGTMELLLAQPVSRTRIIVTQALVTTVGVALLAAMSWLGLYAGIHTTQIDEPVALPVLPIPLLGFDPSAMLSAAETRPVAMSTKVSAAVMWPAALNLFALGFFLSGLTTLVSAVDRYRWRTIGIVAAFYVVQLIMKIVGLAAERFAWLLRWTFLSAYEPERFVSVAVNRPQETWQLVTVDQAGATSQLGPLGCILVLLGMGLAAYVAAIVVFRYRDLPAPV